jgi:lipid-A-disaccharide synthase-like uncharacterized protein
MVDKINQIFSHEITFWLILGLLGQAIFAGRFVVQWIASEIEKKSVIPVSFWHMSVVGSLLTLAYAFHKADPVFILGYLFNCLIYFRNLYFIYTHKEKQAQE